MSAFIKSIVVVIMTFYAPAAFSQKTFTNPLLPTGPDPWVIHKEGYYYYMNTTGHNLTIWKTTNIANLATAEKKVVWTPPSTGPFSKDIWAPEIHFLYGKWYIYFAADSGYNSSHRLYVLENDSRDPLEGTWKMKGKLTTPGDKWSIDGSVFEHNKQLYLIWSGWAGNVNGRQDIYIAKMKNPWTVEGQRVMLSAPTFDWETHGDLHNLNDVPHVNVNEGPEILMHGNKIFLIFSASGCWTDTYSLGMLTAGANSDLLKATSWKKSPQPVFKESPEDSVFAPGHNSFFKSPDGKEDWILYHANSKPGQGCGPHRSPRAQKFSWKKDGTPDFGKPVAAGVALPIPSGGHQRLHKRIGTPVTRISSPNLSH
jgi:GH43 family beta-xylosidase